MDTYSHAMFIFVATMFSITIHSIGVLLINYKRQIPGMFDMMSCYTISFVCIGSYMYRSTYWPRQTILTLMMSAWGFRLGTYLYKRAPYLDDLPPFEIDIWFGRTLWTTIVSVTCVAVNVLDQVRRTFNLNTIIGVVISIIGFILEWKADNEKNSWHKKNPKRPHFKSEIVPCCSKGLWRVCRHPNYLGSLIFHWGCYLIVCDVVPLWVITSPMFVTLTICVFEGGMRTLEHEKSLRFFCHESYQNYVKSVPLLIPVLFFTSRGQQRNAEQKSKTGK